jgi:hypothetical protein
MEIGGDFGDQVEDYVNLRVDAEQILVAHHAEDPPSLTFKEKVTLQLYLLRYSHELVERSHKDD